ncbi:MAG: hypothetical protein COV59_02665 [Candidatus Magasanikbacteria bacterium CG11_big_fil_rev_8_21_14_0_20_39_34]|uniref:Uncharacterized protein n=1 Tax=Candidatus Magasanikbacteria bacterium CG11_big_fil_rev_8_21_14_0_20_39_34 TaxID=1974653 RepID=A0A2H0N592_9BACT|nr:MAG: hypothetical protein COV59_02665 [Candidatus Magasanikbacteria bacterium CG11_big_fil_rev_8_21_14_0_20_39_34]
MRNFLEMGRTLPPIEEIENHYPTSKEEMRKFKRRMWEVRTPARLEQKVARFLSEQGYPSAKVQNMLELQRDKLVDFFGTPEEGLKHDYYFHGTGRLKYPGEKYKKKDDIETPGEHQQNKPVEILESVLRDGLEPHTDIWHPTKDDEFVSLTESYFYSKWYASKYMTESDQPQWQLGDPNDYFPFFVYDSIKREFAEVKHLPETVMRVHREKDKMMEMKTKRDAEGFDRSERFQKWLTSFTAYGSEQKGFNAQLDMKSEIEGNWGAVLCVEKKNVQADSDILVLGVHEARTEEIVEPEAIKAVIVPIDHMQDVQAMLEKNGLGDVQVLAMEAVEVYLGQFRMEDLVRRSEGKGEFKVKKGSQW